jgi:hypothetical protein
MEEFGENRFPRARHVQGQRDDISRTSPSQRVTGRFDLGAGHRQRRFR